VQLEEIFRTGDARADNFRSRLFGMFSEDIPRFWGQNPRAPYAWAGRPTLYEGTGWATIDHLFRDPAGRSFVAEQKSELAWMSLRVPAPGRLGPTRPPTRQARLRLVPRGCGRPGAARGEGRRQGRDG
jgi:hypothetical protein